jgi:hypothetical protein
MVGCRIQKTEKIDVAYVKGHKRLLEQKMANSTEEVYDTPKPLLYVDEY